MTVSLTLAEITSTLGHVDDLETQDNPTWVSWSHKGHRYNLALADDAWVLRTWDPDEESSPLGLARTQGQLASLLRSQILS